MRRFTQLFSEMDRTTRSSEKLAAMARYFREAPPADAAWGLFFLSGRKIKRLMTWRVLDEAIRIETGLPEWLMGASYEAVGDGAELMALLHPHEPDAALDEPLHELVAGRILPLRSMADPAKQRDCVRDSWRLMTRAQRLVFNKLLTGNFRVGVAHTSIVKALAEAAGIAPAVMAHRFAGNWEPTAPTFAALLHGGDAQHAAARPDPAQPYPFLLGYPIEGDVATLGAIDHWQVEWKYDGFRAQVIRRAEQCIIWSRGEELITPAFPEIVEAARPLPEGTVFDGEIVAWESDDARAQRLEPRAEAHAGHRECETPGGRPLPFALLQRRINRKVVEASLFPDVPVAYLAFDVLEHAGEDVRPRPLRERRALLERLIGSLSSASRASLRISPVIHVGGWDELAQLRRGSRERRVEGVMLKRGDSAYAVGRRKGDWWKWKIEPYTVDAVLIHAQGGSGRRSGLFTDYTFGVWRAADAAPGRRELVPVAKAYSGLTDDEIRQVDRFIKANTLSRSGPVRMVKPELVFELAFEGLAESDRHRAKLALRFPRIHRWRMDKKPEDADTLESLQTLLAAHLHGTSPRKTRTSRGKQGR